MSAELIHQMYIAYYQRPADPAGLIYWQDQLNANGGGEAGWNAVAAAFATRRPLWKSNWSKDFSNLFSGAFPRMQLSAWFFNP